TVESDGARRDEEIGDLDPPDQPPAFGPTWFLALGAKETAFVGWLDGGRLNISSIATGTTRWTHSLPTTEHEPPTLAADGDSIVAAGGGTVVKWGPNGEAIWSLDLGPADVATVEHAASDAASAPDVVLLFHTEFGSWLCVLDGNARRL